MLPLKSPLSSWVAMPALWWIQRKVRQMSSESVTTDTAVDLKIRVEMLPRMSPQSSWVAMPALWWIQMVVLQRGPLSL